MSLTLVGKHLRGFVLARSSVNFCLSAAKSREDFTHQLPERLFSPHGCAYVLAMRLSAFFVRQIITSKSHTSQRAETGGHCATRPFQSIPKTPCIFARKLTAESRVGPWPAIKWFSIFLSSQKSSKQAWQRCCRASALRSTPNASWGTARFAVIKGPKL